MKGYGVPEPACRVKAYAYMSIPEKGRHVKQRKKPNYMSALKKADM